MQENGDVIRTKSDLYKAMTTMVDSLGDRYSEFLPPARFRLAVHRPKPVELTYHEAQLTGEPLGMILGTADTSLIVRARRLNDGMAITL